MQLHACIQLSSAAEHHLAAALEPEAAHVGQVDWLSPVLWRVYLAGFGNVTRGDAARLVEMFRERLAGVRAPRLTLSKVEPLLYPGDDSIWVGLDGEVAELEALAAAVPRWVHELGFVPDRRKFRPWVQVGTITPATELGYLEQLVQRLGEYRGFVWAPSAVTLGRARQAAPDHDAALDIFDTADFAG